MLLGQIVQGVFSVLSLPLQTPLRSPETVQPTTSKSIAIVGGGTGGLGALKALLDLPADVRQGWKIDLFDQTTDVGGMWLPQPKPPAPPHLPVTPLYPQLRTNAPHPSMTYPHFPYPPLTPLFPSHEPVQAYHAGFAKHFNLTQYIHFSHTVINAFYHPSLHWRLTILANNSVDTPEERNYDHLIIAQGKNRYPRRPAWIGQDEWLAEGQGQREVKHSLWYREPQQYSNQTVIVVGNGASGRDIAQQVVSFANKLYHSFDNNTSQPFIFPIVPGAVAKPRISHFTPSSVVFADNTTISTSGPVTIILATGYETRVPFLSSLSVSPVVDSNTTSLTTNLRYIRPLYRHSFSLDPSLPTNALAFVGLQTMIAQATSDYALGLFIGHAIAQPSLLPSREDMLRELGDTEDSLAKQGIDPFHNGHRFVIAYSGEEYQNGLINFLRANSSVQLPAFLSNDEPYVDPWRHHGLTDLLTLRRGWLRAEKLGIDQDFIRGAKTEEDWARVMQRLKDWEEKRGEEDGPIDVVDLPF